MTKLIAGEIVSAIIGYIAENQPPELTNEILLRAIQQVNYKSRFLDIFNDILPVETSDLELSWAGKVNARKLIAEVAIVNIHKLLSSDYGAGNIQIIEDM